MPIHCKTRPKESEILLYIQCDGKLEEPDIAHFSEFFKQHLQNDLLIKMFVDMRTVNGANMDCIKALVSFMNDHEDTARDKVLATAILITAPSIEQLVKLLFKFKKPNTPTTVTTDINKACEFLD